MGRGGGGGNWFKKFDHNIILLFIWCLIPKEIQLLFIGLRTMKLRMEDRCMVCGEWHFRIFCHPVQEWRNGFETIIMIMEDTVNSTNVCQTKQDDEVKTGTWDLIYKKWLPIWPSIGPHHSCWNPQRRLRFSVRKFRGHSARPLIPRPHKHSLFCRSVTPANIHKWWYNTMIFFSN